MGELSKTLLFNVIISNTSASSSWSTKLPLNAAEGCNRRQHPRPERERERMGAGVRERAYVRCLLKKKKRREREREREAHARVCV